VVNQSRKEQEHEVNKTKNMNNNGLQNKIHNIIKDLKKISADVTVCGFREQK